MLRDRGGAAKMLGAAAVAAAFVTAAALPAYANPSTEEVYGSGATPALAAHSAVSTCVDEGGTPTYQYGTPEKQSDGTYQVWVYCTFNT